MKKGIFLSILIISILVSFVAGSLTPVLILTPMQVTHNESSLLDSYLALSLLKEGKYDRAAEYFRIKLEGQLTGCAIPENQAFSKDMRKILLKTHDFLKKYPLEYQSSEVREKVEAMFNRLLSSP